MRLDQLEAFPLQAEAVGLKGVLVLPGLKSPLREAASLLPQRTLIRSLILIMQ
jgi:hypothetical protein